MTDPDLRQELARLSERLDRLEQLLNLEALDPKKSDTTTAEPTAPVATPSTAPPTAPPLADQREPIHVSDRKAAAFHRVTATSVPSLGGTQPPVSSSAPPVSSARIHSTPVGMAPARSGAGPSPVRRNPISLELLIGGRGMAWVGALAVVVSIALLMKIAYDEGWFRVVSIPMRCAISAVFGLAMLGAGEVALRKIGRAASVGLFGAGLGTLYVTTLVSFRLEVLGSAGLTLLLLGVVAVIGIAVAVRAGLLSIGVISIIAGYAAPVLVPDAGAFRAALPSYLTMLLLVGLALSAWQPRPFRTLRLVTFGAHALLATLWVINVGPAGGILELTFMAGWWMMITGEVLYAAIRRQSSLGNAIISLLTTAWFALFGCVLLNTTTALPVGLTGGFAAGVGVLAGAIALQFGPGLDTLRRAPQNAIEKLAVSLWVQAGCLLVIAAALQFSDYGTTIAWLILGMAAIEVGRHIRSVATDRFGLVVVALGLLRLLSIDLFRGVGITAISLGSVSISQWGVLALGAVAVLHLAAWRLRQTDSSLRRWTPGVLVILSVLLWLLATLIEFNEHDLLDSAAWLGGAAALVLAGAVVRRLPYLQVGAGMVALTALRLMAVDLINVAPVTAVAVGSLSISQWGVLALSCIAGLHIAAWLLRATDSFARAQAATVLVVMSAVLWLLATQVDLRTNGVLVTVAWLGGATTLVALGAVVQRLPYLQVGAALIACTALRWVGVDMLGVRSQSLADWVAVMPLLNTSALVGLLVIASGWLFLWADRYSKRRLGIRDRESTLPVLYGMGLMLMILLSFEIDRAVAIYEQSQGETLRERWAPGQLLSLWLTLLWGMTGLFTAMFGAWQRKQLLFAVGTWVAALCAGAWLTWDTLLYRVTSSVGGASVVFNLQFFVGLMLAVGLGASVRLIGYRRAGTKYLFALDPEGHFARVALTLVACIGLWLGSLEVDRLFNPDFSSLTNAAMARQTGLSIYWGLYGIALVGIGFVWRLAPSRYAGLALLAITLLKVVVIDMSDVQYIYRVASFMGVGLLFVLTSIGYAKMSPQLLAAEHDGTRSDVEPS